jgi:hypothetical protein
MTLKRLVVAGVLLAVVWSSGAAALQLGIDPNYKLPLDAVEQWMAALLQHDPGVIETELLRSASDRTVTSMPCTSMRPRSSA